MIHGGALLGIVTVSSISLLIQRHMSGLAIVILVLDIGI